MLETSWAFCSKCITATGMHLCMQVEQYGGDWEEL